MLVHTAHRLEAADQNTLHLKLSNTAPVISAVFSSDGRHVVTASGENTARVRQESWSLIGDLQELIGNACGRMNLEIRRITREDVELVPLITAIGKKVGEDACEGVAITPFP